MGSVVVRTPSRLYPTARRDLVKSVTTTGLAGDVRCSLSRALTFAGVAVMLAVIAAENGMDENRTYSGRLNSVPEAALKTEGPELQRSNKVRGSSVASSNVPLSFAVFRNPSIRADVGCQRPAGGKGDQTDQESRRLPAGPVPSTRPVQMDFLHPG